MDISELALSQKGVKNVHLNNVENSGSSGVEDPVVEKHITKAPPAKEPDQQSKTETSEPQTPDYSEVLSKTGFKSLDELFSHVENSKKPVNVYELLSRELGNPNIKGKDELLSLINKPSVLDDDTAMYFYNAKANGIDEDLAYLLKKTKMDSLAGKDIIGLYQRSQVPELTNEDIDSFLEDLGYSNEEGKETGNWKYKQELKKAKDWLNEIQKKIQPVDFKSQMESQRKTEIQLRESASKSFEDVKKLIVDDITSKGIPSPDGKEPLDIDWTPDMKSYISEQMSNIQEEIKKLPANAFSKTFIKDLTENIYANIHKDILYKFMPDIISQVRKKAILEQDAKVDNPRKPKDAKPEGINTLISKKNAEAQKEALKSFGIY